ncbi:DUF1775 domain-containing protein [Micromonospora sp. NPDC000316]|uniref:DUF1775 domain-containing protein n=1 Tax=Micromonospora sp. NPDC000316 TaxID=3364216 RepID=UPI003686668E
MTALTAAGLLLGWPGTAHAADVTTTPTEARQGDAVRLEFSVPEERAGTTTRQIEVRLPADAPVAEVYPMSVDGWAPKISSRTLDKPVAGMHASGVTTVTTAVTWVRVGESTPGPARLALSMGPLPQAERLAFEVVQTYADGTVVRWADVDGAHRAPVLTLLPAAAGTGGPGGPAGHGGHGAAVAGAGGAGEESGNADAMLAAGLLAGLGGGAAIGWLVSRWRRRDPAERAELAELAEVAGATDDETVVATPPQDGRAASTPPANAAALTSAATPARTT